ANGWRESILHTFQGGSEGAAPYDTPIFDSSGNLYGTTIGGGPGGRGTVFDLTPSGGNWTLSTLYGFSEGTGGFNPQSGLVMDHAGNLYGTTAGGGAYGFGNVFE